MAFKNAYIPYGGYWSTPFCRWQGSFQNQHAITFAAEPICIPAPETAKGITIAAAMAIMTTTIIISAKVKPWYPGFFIRIILSPLFNQES